MALVRSGTLPAYLRIRERMRAPTQFVSVRLARFTSCSAPSRMQPVFQGVFSSGAVASVSRG